MLLVPNLSKSSTSGLTVFESVHKINREKALVFDLGSEQEFGAGHVPGARHLPLEKFEQQLPKAVRDKNHTIILVCAQGVRSRRAVALAQKLGYTQVFTLSGGLKAWREANQPLVKG